jgi:predicted porin
MNKHILTAGVLASLCGMAHAQSGVTMYGTIDGGLRWVDNVGTTAATKGDNKLSIGTVGTLDFNRFGFRGVEDLGNGLSTHFSLESGYNSGTGANSDSTRFFNRMALVGVTGAWGTVDIGRQYTLSGKVLYAYEPFGFFFPTIVPASGLNGASGIRFDNDVQYTGVFGPVTLRAEHAFGEVAGNAGSGAASAVGANYKSGPLAVGAAYTVRKPGPTSSNLGVTVINPVVYAIPAGTFQDNRHWTAGAAYQFEKLRIAVGASDEKQENGALVDTHLKLTWFGGSYALMPQLNLKAGWYRTKTTGPGTAAYPRGLDGKKDLYIAALLYSLSKRTTLYLEVDKTKLAGSNTGSATLGGSAVSPGTSPFGQTRLDGISTGIYHAF